MSVWAAWAMANVAVSAMRDAGASRNAAERMTSKERMTNVLRLGAAESVSQARLHIQLCETRHKGARFQQHTFADHRRKGRLAPFNLAKMAKIKSRRFRMFTRILAV